MITRLSSSVMSRKRELETVTSANYAGKSMSTVPVAIPGILDHHTVNKNSSTASAKPSMSVCSSGSDSEMNPRRP
jgi:hypothetical protein